MISNRSVPTDTLLSQVVYLDVVEAIAWLEKTFGFREHYRYGEPGGLVSGAQMQLGNVWIMLVRARSGHASPLQVGSGTQSLTVFVEDIESHFQKTKSAAAKILEDLHETVYVEYQYGVEDLAGHHWLFSRHARDLSPADWGAAISQPATTPTQIAPMLAVSDGKTAIEFYKAAFGANLLWSLDGDGHVVAGLSIDDSRFFLADEAPAYGTRGPASAGFTTVRIELFVDDPLAVHKQALAAGAVEQGPVCEHQHSTVAATHKADAARCSGRSVWTYVAHRKVPRVADQSWIRCVFEYAFRRVKKLHIFL